MDKILEKNLVKIAENVPKVYESGVKEGYNNGIDTAIVTQEEFLADKPKTYYDAFWDDVQDYGNRTNYSDAFKNWSSTTINPKYPIKTTTLYALFINCRNLEALPIITCANEDGQYQTCYTAFQLCLKLKSIDFDVKSNATTSSVWSNTFSDCQELKSIKKICVFEYQTFSKTFHYCYALENIIIEGVIGQNGFDVHWSTKLSKASIESIINSLSTTTSGLTVTLSQTAVDNAFETAEGLADGSTSAEWTSLCNTRSNWTITLV